MARFYGSIHGNRGEATRMGTPSSGFTGHVRGWKVGGYVDLRADGDDDVCEIRATTGSNGGGNGRPLAVLRSSPTGRTIILYGKDGKPSKPLAFD